MVSVVNVDTDVAHADHKVEHVLDKDKGFVGEYSGDIVS